MTEKKSDPNPQSYWKSPLYLWTCLCMDIDHEMETKAKESDYYQQIYGGEKIQTYLGIMGKKIKLRRNLQLQ